MDTPNNAKMFKGALKDVTIPVDNDDVLSSLSIDSSLDNFVGIGL